jgi:hypothetical protein
VRSKKEAGMQLETPLNHVEKHKSFVYGTIWGTAVVFLYTTRRVNCRRCGVRVEYLPWSVGKSSVTRTFTIFLARWAKLLSWSEVASLFGATWRKAYDAVRHVVEYGLAGREMDGDHPAIESSLLTWHGPRPFGSACAPHAARRSTPPRTTAPPSALRRRLWRE